MSTLKTKEKLTKEHEMDEQLARLYVKRYRNLCKVRALHEVVVLRLDELHGAALTGLGNEAAPAGVLIGMGESMDEQTFLFSPKSGDQRSQMAIAAISDEYIKSEHDHSYLILRNHLQREGVEDGNVHWGCLEHGIWPFFTSDMMRSISIIRGGDMEMRRYLEKTVGVYFFGEGAISQGVAHEVMTWLSAQNYKRSQEQLKKYDGMPLSERTKRSGVLRPVPGLACVQINRWSIYTDEIDEHGGRAEIGRGGKSKFARWAETYGVRGIDVNGDDLDDVIDKTKDAVKHSQLEVPKPTLLVLHMETRRTGHNEHQIHRDPEDRKHRRWWKGKIEGIDPALFEKAWESEPLKRYREKLVAQGIGTEEGFLEILEDERAMMEERWERALREKPATFQSAVEKRKRPCFMFAPHEWTLPHKERFSAEDKDGRITTDRALLRVIEEIMSEDEGVTYCGEDVGSGGVLVATRRLQRKFGPERVFDTPIAEEAILGITAGGSLARWTLRKHGIVSTRGTKICEAQFMPFDGDWEVLMRNIGPNWYQKNIPFQFIAIAHYGVVHAGGSGNYHSDCVEGHYLNMPGIAVVCPSDAYDLVGLFRAAYECGWPVVFMSSIWSYGEKECSAKIPEEKYLIPLGKAAVKRTGTHLSVFTYGNCVRAALAEAEFLARDGIDIEVVDLRSLEPLDMDTIAASFKKTKRAVVMTEAAPQVAEMLIGRIVSNLHLSDVITRTPKPRQQKGEGMAHFQERVAKWLREEMDPVFREFSKYDLDIHNHGPRIARLSRDWSPIASAEDIEWGDLPFEWYIDDSGLKRLRAVRLSAIAHEMMRY